MSDMIETIKHATKLTVSSAGGFSGGTNDLSNVNFSDIGTDQQTAIKGCLERIWTSKESGESLGNFGIQITVDDQILCTYRSGVALENLCELIKILQAFNLIKNPSRNLMNPAIVTMTIYDEKFGEWLEEEMAKLHARQQQGGR
jgi:hypothetical protein